MKNEMGYLHDATRSGITNLKFPQVGLSCSATAVMRYNQTPTGVVVELTATRTLIVPVFENQVVRSAIKKMERVTGRTLDDFLHNLITEKQLVTGENIWLKESLPDIKAKLCYISLDYQSDLEAYRHDEEDSWSATWNRPAELRDQFAPMQSITLT